MHLYCLAIHPHYSPSYPGMPHGYSHDRSPCFVFWGVLVPVITVTNKQKDYRLWVKTITLPHICHVTCTSTNVTMIMTPLKNMQGIKGLSASSNNKYILCSDKMCCHSDQCHDTFIHMPMVAKHHDKWVVWASKQKKCNLKSQPYHSCSLEKWLEPSTPASRANRAARTLAKRSIHRRPLGPEKGGGKSNSSFGSSGGNAPRWGSVPATSGHQPLI